MKQTRKEGVGSDVIGRFAGLSAAKRTLLQQRLKAKSAAFPLSEPLCPRRTSDPAPLSFAQERLWFLDQYEPGNPVYNISQGLRLSGPLNIAALDRSINEITRRHETLRTTFSILEGEPAQIIAVPVERSVLVVDLSDRTASRGESEARRLAQKEARHPFDLSQGPLFRVTLIRLGEDDHVLLLTMHHIVSDGWSMGLLDRELAVLYGAFSQAQPSPLSELPIQYADYALWQREWLQGEVLDGQLSYWKKQLEGAPGVLDLPTDRPRLAVQSYRGARTSFELPKELTEQLKVLSRKENATLFMTLLAAFQALLHRYTGQPDIVVGSPIANRNRTEIESLIGFFVNTLIMRTDLSGNPSFRELLQRVRKVALEAYDHQDLPFEKLVEDLNPERSLSHSPLFQVMFVLQTASAGALELQGLSLTPVALTSEQSKFDLTLSMHDGQRGLRGSLGYRSDLFDDVTMARMSGHYRSLLEGIVENPDRRISELPLLTVAEKRQLLVEWDDTQKDYPWERCMHELFEAQVARSPEAAALIFEGEQLTYRELNARANQLAHYLSKRGVGPEVLVGICLERSPEMLVTLLAILKAGGAYVPLDPDYPDDRITFMLQDSDTRLIITERRLAERFSHQPTRVRCLDEEWENVNQESCQDPITHVKPENLAYVLYTSGTTGIPKGVLIEHRSLINYLSWFNRIEIVGEGQVIPFVTKFTFDASLKQFFSPLLRGSPVWILPDEVTGEPGRLVKALNTRSGTVLNCVPTLWNALLEGIESNQMVLSREAVSVLLLGGEKFDRSLIDRTRAVFPQVEIWNLYGPTEATANALAGRITGEGSTALGKSITNVKRALLNANLQLVPVGVTGELYIGGVGLARGYLGGADLTAEKFIPDPFSKEPGARLYKTGDLARYLPDGNIEFLGRTDDQVKLRGFRIQLREIEVILSQHPLVKESVVVVQEDLPGDRRLVAYVVSWQDSESLTNELRRFLKQKLPHYMMPSVFRFLDSLPLNANGKVDRSALIEIQPTSANPKGLLAVARDDLELQLTQVWERLLRTRPIGLKDNFFDLGGHSLMAVRLLSQVEKVTGRRLSLATLFQAPTIEEQAKLVRSEGWSSPWSSLVAIQPGGSKPPLFCVHAHDGNVLFWRELSRRLGPEQPFYGLQAHGLDGKQNPDTRIEDMASRYVKEIRLLQPEGPYFLGGHCFGGLVAFEMAQQLHTQGQKVALLALMDSFAPWGRPTSGKQTSRRGPLSHRIKDALDLVTLHIDNLMLLSQSERLAYVEVKFNRLLYKIYMSVGARWVPAAQARLRILDAGSKALRSYTPKVYPGAITLFRATQMPVGLRGQPQDRWAKLAAGGLETHLIPGYFAQTVYEPRVRLLAKELIRSLSEAQAEKQTLPERTKRISGKCQLW